MEVLRKTRRMDNGIKERIIFMLDHMTTEGLERTYAIVQRLWLRHNTGVRTHK